jgi:hypothetical protein
MGKKSKLFVLEQKLSGTKIIIVFLEQLLHPGRGQLFYGGIPLHSMDSLYN